MLPPIMPVVGELAPEIAIAGNRLEIRGRLFGTAEGTVELNADAPVSPRTRALPILSWTDTRVEVQVPPDAHSGTIRVARSMAGGAGSADVYLAVVRRVEGELGTAVPPLVLTGGTQPASNTPIAALYSARTSGMQFEAAMERIVGLESDGSRYEPFVTTSALSAVAGSFYGEPLNLFLFVASPIQGNAMSATLISSSTITANPRRFTNAVNTAGADGIGVILLWAQPNTVVPAVMVYSKNGVIRMGTASDLLAGPFGAWQTLTSTGAQAEFVTIERKAAGAGYDYLMAYRDGGMLRGQLFVQTATGLGGPPGGFIRPNFANRPAMGERVRILDVPGEGFVLVYEERQTGGRPDVRILKYGDYGVAPGYAPFRETAQSRRLEDAGVVLRNGRPWIALATTTRQAGSRLNYAEIPMSAVAMRDGRGDTEGIELDFAPDRMGDPAPAAQLGCRPVASQTCPIVWLGKTQPSLLFVRR
jgi:hypothetical protein